MSKDWGGLRPGEAVRPWPSPGIVSAHCDVNESINDIRRSVTSKRLLPKSKRFLLTSKRVLPASKSVLLTPKRALLTPKQLGRPVAWGGCQPWPGHSVVSVRCDTKRGESLISLLKKSVVIHCNKTYCGVRVSETFIKYFVIFVFNSSNSRIYLTFFFSKSYQLCVWILKLRIQFID